MSEDIARPLYQVPQFAVAESNATLLAQHPQKENVEQRVHALMPESVSAEDKQAITESVLKALPTAAASAKAATTPDNTVANDNHQLGLNFKKMSIDAVIYAVMLDRYDAMQDLVQKQATKVQQMNDQLRALGLLKAGIAVYGTDVSKPNKGIKLDKQGSTYTDLDKIIKDNHLDINLASLITPITGEITQGNLAKLSQTIDTLTTSATNIQSAEYNKLQDFAQKLTQALDLASNVSKKFADTNAGVVANLR